MSEFSTQAEPEPIVPPASRRSSSPASEWLTKPLLLGQSAPWLALYAVVLIAAGWYLFAPESSPSTNRLAFAEQDIVANQPAIATPRIEAHATQIQDQVVTMVTGVRTYAEANRDAITQLAATVKVLMESQVVLRQQISELQAHSALQSARPAARPANRIAQSRPGKAADTPSPLAGMRVSAIQNGMAWVTWQDKTWAVQVGDTLGPVTVTGIDAKARRVRTSAGALE